MANIWFVVHHHDLWDIDNSRIGFHLKYQWEQLKRGDIIIYYRMGEKKIKGVYRILKKEIEKWNSNPRFVAVGKYKDLGYQCKLELLSNNIIYGETSNKKRGSPLPKFFKNLKGCHGQVFSVKKEDLKLVLANPSILCFLDNNPPHESDASRHLNPIHSSTVGGFNVNKAQDSINAS